MCGRGVMAARCVEAFSKAVTMMKLLRSSTLGKNGTGTVLDKSINFPLIGQS